MISLLVSASLTSSSAFAATSTAAPSLFGLNLHLHPKAIGDFVGFPRDEAGAILEVFEKRVPAMQREILDLETISSLKDKSIKTASDTISLKDKIIADQQQELGRVEKAANPSFFETREFWFVVGVVVGAITTKILVK